MVLEQVGGAEDLPVLRNPIHRPVRVERISTGTRLLLPRQDGQEGSSSAVDPLVLEEAQRQQW